MGGVSTRLMVRPIARDAQRVDRRARPRLAAPTGLTAIHTAMHMCNSHLHSRFHSHPQAYRSPPLPSPLLTPPLPSPLFPPLPSPQASPLARGHGSWEDGLDEAADGPAPVLTHRRSHSDPVQAALKGSLRGAMSRKSADFAAPPPVATKPEKSGRARWETVMAAEEAGELAAEADSLRGDSEGPWCAGAPSKADNSSAAVSAFWRRGAGATGSGGRAIASGEASLSRVAATDAAAAGSNGAGGKVSGPRGFQVFDDIGHAHAAQSGQVSDATCLCAHLRFTPHAHTSAHTSGERRDRLRLARAGALAVDG